MRLIAHVGAVHVVGDPPARVLVHVVLTGPDAAETAETAETADIVDTDESGREVVTLNGVRYAPMDGDDPVAATTQPRQLVHEMAWRPLELPAEERDRPLGTVILVGGDTALAGALRTAVEGAGTPCLTVPDAAGRPPSTAATVVLVRRHRSRDAGADRGRPGAGSARGDRPLLALDVADADRAAALLTPDALGLPAIRGVVHAAGVLDNRTVADLSEESLRTVMRPKVDGALVLHELFPPGSVGFFVLFFSSGQLLRLTGQASYASANAFLDALALHRRATGHADTISFGWSSWRGTGMAATVSVPADELWERLVDEIGRQVAAEMNSWRQTSTRAGRWSRSDSTPSCR